MKRRDRSSAGNCSGIIRLGIKHTEMLVALQGEDGHWSEAPTTGESAMCLINPTVQAS